MLFTCGAFVGTSCDTDSFQYPPGRPIIERFDATPFSIVAGETAQLSWRVRDADEVRIGEILVDAPSEGSAAIQPTTRRTYTLVARNAAGTSSAAATVIVRERERVQIERFDVRPAAQEPGGPVVVAWRVRSATDLALMTSDGAVMIDDAPPEGSIVIRPAADVLVTLQAGGPGGPLMVKQLVRVRKRWPAILEFTLSPSIIGPTDTARLRWRVAHAERISLAERYTGGSSVLWSDAPGEHEIEVSGADGSRSFQIEASTDAQTASASAALTVLGAPPLRIERFELDPAMTGPGGDVQVHVRTRGAERIQLRYRAFWDVVVANRTVFVAHTGTVSFGLQLVVSSAQTTLTASRTVTVDSTWPGIEEAVADPVLVSPGAEVQVRWRASRADETRILTEWGELLHRVQGDSGTVTLRPAASQTLRLEAENQKGTTRREVRISAY